MTNTFLVSCPKGQVKQNVNVEAWENCHEKKQVDFNFALGAEEMRLIARIPLCLQMDKDRHITK
jgi:hypothetical protein